MSSPISTDEPTPGGFTPAVQWLLIANVAVFFLQQTIVRLSDLEAIFAFTTTDVVTRWWTPLTYAFLHGSIWHIAFNMFALWQFGPKVERMFGTARFVRFYAACALGGALLHFVAPLLIPQQGGLMIGASAAVFGVMYAFAHAWPRTILLLFGVIPMQVRWYVLGFAALSVVLGVSGGQSGVAHWAHLGGFATAWLLVRLPSARKLGSWQERFNRVPERPEDETLRAVPPRSALRPPRVNEAPDAADDVVARSNAIVRRRPPTASPPRPAATAVIAPAQSATEELNALLDKMSSGGGRASLSDREQERLRELSEILRGQR